MFCHIALIITTFVAGAQASCSENGVEHCTTEILDFRNKTGISGRQSVSLESLNDEQLNTYCKYGQKAAACLNEVNYCDKIVNKQFEGFLDSINFLCDETLEEYKRHRHCYATNKVHSTLVRCESFASHHFADPINADPGFQYDNLHTYKDKLCSWLHGTAAEDYLCIRHMIQPMCGKAAADWQINYVKKAITPMISAVHCTALPTWAIVVISVVLFVIISAVLGKVIGDRTCCKDNPATPEFNNILSNPAAAEASLQSSDSVKLDNMY